jgi:ArsR family transcriptional regulator, arsenate/arsenite/antimonite-responsive transcriptional repressor
LNDRADQASRQKLGYFHTLMIIKLWWFQFLRSGVLHWDLNSMERKELVEISKALSDPTRLQIYEGISACKEMFCSQVVAKYGLTPGTISHHLKILADANLIETRREGQFIYVKSQPETIREYGRSLAKMAGKRKAVSKR